MSRRQSSSDSVHIDVEGPSESPGPELPASPAAAQQQHTGNAHAIHNVIDQLLHEMDSRYPDMPAPFRERFLATVQLIQHATNNRQQGTAASSSGRDTTVGASLEGGEGADAADDTNTDTPRSDNSVSSSDPLAPNDEGDYDVESGSRSLVPVRVGRVGRARRNRQRRVFRVQGGTGAPEEDTDGAGNGGGDSQALARHTLLNQNNEVRELIRFAQTPEAKILLSGILAILPFVLAIGCKVLLDHMWRLSALLFAIVFYVISNVTLVNCLAVPALHNNSCRSSLRRAFQYFKASFGPCVWLYLTCVLFYSQCLWYPNAFYLSVPPQFATERSSICTSLWRIFVADTNAKFAGMLLKVLVCLFCCVSSTRRRCRLFPVIEYSTQLYRYAMPVTVWSTYLLSHGHNDGWFYLACNYVFLSVYLLAKAWQVRTPVRRVFSALHACVRRSAFGVTPSDEALNKAAESCSICFGPYHAPIQLSCEHIFCESCIATWLDRERTCPICRAQVSQEDNKYKDASTSCLIQIF